MLFVLFQHIGITYHSYKIDSNFERKINYNYFGRSKEGTKTKLFKIFKKKRKKGEEVKFLTLGKQQRYKKESKICIHNQVPEHPSY